MRRLFDVWGRRECKQKAVRVAHGSKGKSIFKSLRIFKFSLQFLNFAQRQVSKFRNILKRIVSF